MQGELLAYLNGVFSCIGLCIDNTCTLEYSNINPKTPTNDFPNCKPTTPPHPTRLGSLAATENVGIYFLIHVPGGPGYEIVQTRGVGLRAYMRAYAPALLPRAPAYKATSPLYKQVSLFTNRATLLMGRQSGTSRWLIFKVNDIIFPPAPKRVGAQVEQVQKKQLMML